ncbi:DUF485 domain-containing protein [Yunchengibacter salinarum]|uniref:DUF485 domain-containing protein n=1 Tax=Yunchengibacter salinarum TaxID=3133399 RepID=UPI0035B5E823
MTDQAAINAIIRRRLRVAVRATLGLLGLLALYVYALAGQPGWAMSPLMLGLNGTVWLSILIVLAGAGTAGFYSWWSINRLDPEIRRLKDRANAADRAANGEAGQ